MDQKLLIPLLFSVVVIFGIYRRARRTFGRQRVNVTRLRLRIGVLTAVAALLLWGPHGNLQLVGAVLAGIVAGALLAQFGLRHTAFEVTPQGHFYTPHTYIGVVVTALFVGRLLFRFLSVYSQAHATTQATADPFAGVQTNLSTLAIAGVLIGYYVFFNLGVLRASKNKPAAGGTPAPGND